jgi:hypothetical protein
MYYQELSWDIIISNMVLAHIVSCLFCLFEIRIFLIYTVCSFLRSGAWLRVKRIISSSLILLYSRDLTQWMEEEFGLVCWLAGRHLSIVYCTYYRMKKQVSTWWLSYNVRTYVNFFNIMKEDNKKYKLNIFLIFLTKKSERLWQTYCSALDSFACH